MGSLLVLSATILALLTLTAVPALVVLLGANGTASSPSKTARAAATTACRVAGDAALRAHSTETPEGYRSYEEWVAGARGRQAVGKLWASLAPQFGTITKTGGPPSSSVASSAWPWSWWWSTPAGSTRPRCSGGWMPRRRPG